MARGLLVLLAASMVGVGACVGRGHVAPQGSSSSSSFPTENHQGQGGRQTNYGPTHHSGQSFRDHRLSHPYPTSRWNSSTRDSEQFQRTRSYWHRDWHRVSGTELLAQSYVNRASSSTASSSTVAANTGQASGLPGSSRYLQEHLLEYRFDTQKHPHRGRTQTRLIASTH